METNCIYDHQAEKIATKPYLNYFAKQESKCGVRVTKFLVNHVIQQASFTYLMNFVTALTLDKERTKNV